MPKSGRYLHPALVWSDLLGTGDELEHLPVIAKMLKKAWCIVGGTSQKFG